MSVWVGVDPGAKETGVVVRDGGTLHAVELVVRGDDLDDYLRTVAATVGELSAEWDADIAVEDVNKPSFYLDGKEAPLLNLDPLLETAQVLGHVRGTFLCTVVAPAGFSKNPKLPPGPHLDAAMSQEFPPELLGSREVGGKYEGQLRHCRSAWRIAGAAEKATRQQQIGGLR